MADFKENTFRIGRWESAEYGNNCRRRKGRYRKEPWERAWKQGKKLSRQNWRHRTKNFGKVRHGIYPRWQGPGIEPWRARLSIIAESVKIGFRTAEKLTIANREKWKAQPVMILPPALTDLSWLPDATAIGCMHGMRCLDSGAMTKTDNLKRKDGHHALWSSGGRFLSAAYSLIGERILNGHYIDVFSPSHMLYCNCLCLWEVL